MKEIKKITENGYTMIHSWSFDDFGLKKNSFDLFEEATKTHFPFFGNIRVSNYDINKFFEGDNISPYTDEEYLEMLRKEIKRINHKEE